MELLCKAQFFIIYNFSLWWGAIRPEIYCRVFGNFYKNCSLRIKCTPTSNNFSSLWSQFPSIFLLLLLTSKHLLLPPPTKTFSHMIQISLLKPPIPPFLAFTEAARPSAGSHKMVALLCSGHRGGCLAVSSYAAACIRHCPEMEAHVYSRAVVSYKVVAIRILFSFLVSALLYSTQTVFWGIIILWWYHALTSQ